MNQDLWTAVDHYIAANLLAPDSVLDETLRANVTAGLPAYDVAVNQGKLLYLLARIKGAKRILEIGTLGAYSTIWLAKALPPDGRLISLEVDPKYAEVASANIARAGFSSVIDLRVGPALQSLSQLHHEGASGFDLIFIDADKRNNPDYLDWALRFSRLGTIIIADNVVRNGLVADPHSADPSVQGIRRFFEKLAAEPRLESTALQTVGVKGYDGFCLALVVKEAK